MSEHPPHTPEHTVRPATEPGMPDMRRLEVAFGRFSEPITNGIAMALAEGTEIDRDTARCIAHVLGRAHGRHSALAGFGRTGEGDYLTMRDEYLTLYTHDHADAVTRELVDWLGTHLVARENTGTGRRFMNEHLPPKLDQLLVRSTVHIDGHAFEVNVPASRDSRSIDELTATLAALDLPRDEALQAFLTLPDVDAGALNLMETFHDVFVGTYAYMEDAIAQLADIEGLDRDLRTATDDRGLPENAATIDYDLMKEHLEIAYDIIPKGWQIHVFNK